MGTGDRYEFRCWGEDLTAQKALLDEDWRRKGGERSSEIYILGGDDRFAVKLRNGTFSVKEKLKVEGKLELWQPVADITFPLSMDELAPWLEQAFGLTGAITAGEEDMSEAALKTFLTGRSGVQVIPVEKERRRFELAGVLAEYTVVDAADRRIGTVAVEGEEPTAVHTGMRLLRIEERENKAYPAKLLELAKKG